MTWLETSPLDESEPQFKDPIEVWLWIPKTAMKTGGAANLWVPMAITSVRQQAVRRGLAALHPWNARAIRIAEVINIFVL